MAGSMRLVPGKTNAWQLRVYLGRDSTGRVRHRHTSFHGTRRQAERELARLVAEQDAIPEAVPEQPKVWGVTTTVNDAIAAWKENGWDDLSPKTTLRYESVWANHIKDSIGRERIATLGTYDVERYFRELKGAPDTTQSCVFACATDAEATGAARRLTARRSVAHVRKRRPSTPWISSQEAGSSPSGSRATCEPPLES